MTKKLLGSLLLFAALGSLTACPKSDTTSDGGTKTLPDGGKVPVDAGVPDPFGSTGNSITVATGLGRADPEGIAPTSPSTQKLTWKDSRGADRSMILYGYLYQYDFSFAGGEADPTTVTTRSAGDTAYGHPGFGYLVSHNTSTDNSPIGKGNAPSVVETNLFSGAHHAIHHIELVYNRDLEGGGNGIKIPASIDWFVATGRDHPVWSVNWKMSQVVNPNGTDFTTYRMDSRAPYGSLAFDGAATLAEGDAIGGVSWGDFQKRFISGGTELNMQDAWTYNTANTINFVQAWTETVNSEMGIVETKPNDNTMGYSDMVRGRQQGAVSVAATSCAFIGDARSYLMPCVDGWPYQLMNYDWEPGGTALTDGTSTKLVAWGTNYGFLGASDAQTFDDNSYDATGDRAYSTFIVLGPKCRYAGAGCDSTLGDVNTTLAAVTALSSASVTATTGTSTGYDSTFAIYDLAAAGNAASFTFTPAGGKPVAAPIFKITGYASTKLPAIQVNGTAVTVNSGDATSGTFVSLDVANQTLWVTLNQNVSAATTLSIAPGS